MCNFVSWKEKDGEVFYLTNADLKPRKLKKYKEYNANWQEDLCGHGAIDYFYPDTKGRNKECFDFENPKNFPKEIVKSIKNMEMTKIGIDIRLLNEKGQAEYEKIRQPAWAKYEKIRQQAWAKYEKIEQPAWAEYEKIRLQALAEYEKIRQPALAEYKKIEQPALAKYEKIRQQAFWEIFRQKKYRAKGWN